jgi:light-regulated signal transduction histidine kinase (bacteriophytochrome)
VAPAVERREVHAGGRRIDVSLQRSDDHAELVVRDTGDGIMPAALPHLFTVPARTGSASDRAGWGSGCRSCDSSWSCTEEPFGPTAVARAAAPSSG